MGDFSQRDLKLSDIKMKEPKLSCTQGTLWLPSVTLALSGIPLPEILGIKNASPCEDVKQLAQEKKNVAKRKFLLEQWLLAIPGTVKPETKKDASVHHSTF